MEVNGRLANIWPEEQNQPTYKLRLYYEFWQWNNSNNTMQTPLRTIGCGLLFEQVQTFNCMKWLYNQSTLKKQSLSIKKQSNDN